MTANDSMHRRAFLAAGVAATTAAAVRITGQTQQAPPIIDCHIHLFDQTRPQGAPYRGGRGNSEPALPARYKALAAPLGIVGAIEIDASPWIEDNLWVLETIEKEPFMVGTSGNLEPDKPEFKEYVERYHKNKLFLGFRYGNVWGRNFVGLIDNPTFVDGLKLVAQLDLELDSGNPRPDLIAALVKAKDKVPELRIVVEHTANIAPQAPPLGRGTTISAADRATMEANLRDLAKRPHVYFKISEYLRVSPGGAPITDPMVYRPVFDYLMDLFGEDRVVFGSDWPNGNAVNNVDAIVKIARDYFGNKSRSTQEKFFSRNSMAAYKWVKRDASQPSL
jgi:L-fuconolactonase